MSQPAGNKKLFAHGLKSKCIINFVCHSALKGRIDLGTFKDEKLILSSILFSCREMFKSFLTKTLETTKSFENEYLCIQMLSLDLNKEKEYVNDFVKLLDMYLGPIAIHITPPEIFDICQGTTVGNYSIPKSDCLTYMSLAPEIIFWNAITQSLYMGIAKTLHYALDSNTKEILMSNKKILDNFQNCLELKDKKLAKELVAEIKNIFSQFEVTTGILCDPAHFDTIDNIHKGYIPLGFNPLKNWSRDHVMGQYNGFINYSKWLANNKQHYESGAFRPYE